MHEIRTNTRYVDYRQEIARADIAENLAYHLQFIYYAILYDKFELSFRRIVNLGNKIRENRLKWQDDDNTEITSDSMLEYCKKKGIDVLGFVKSIPMSKKLFLSDIKGKRGVLGADRNIESAFAASLLLTIPVLIQSYKFKIDDIGKFFDWIAYYIDSYCKKQPRSKEYYLTDDVIVNQFIEDEGWNIKTGEKVDKNV